MNIKKLKLIAIQMKHIVVGLFIVALFLGQQNEVYGSTTELSLDQQVILFLGASMGSLYANSQENRSDNQFTSEEMTAYFLYPALGAICLNLIGDGFREPEERVDYFKLVSGAFLGSSIGVLSGGLSGGKEYILPISTTFGVSMMVSF